MTQNNYKDTDIQRGKTTTANITTKGPKKL